MIKLTKELDMLLHDDLIRETGGSPGVRDEGLLESAISAPFGGYGGVEQYPLNSAEGSKTLFWSCKKSCLY